MTASETKRPVKLDVSLFGFPSSEIIISLLYSIADLVPCFVGKDLLLERFCFRSRAVSTGQWW